MDAIIGILSRLFSGAGIIIVILLGLFFDYVWPILEYVFYGIAIVILALLAYSMLRLVLILIGEIVNLIVYFPHWLLRIIMGKGRPEWDVVRVEYWQELLEIRIPQQNKKTEN